MTLTPYPFGALVRRMFLELDAQHAIFDLPARRFFGGDAGRDLSVSIHGQRASSPVGPAAGPHTQLAQNIVLAWLAGCRVVELKTVQVRDDLVIPRPCIDMERAGFNIEWSQELRLPESLEEYVKASMLIRILVESGRIPLAPGYADTVVDMSVGYDLAGVTSPTVQAFLDGMADASAIVDRLRRQIPAEFARYRDLDFARCLSTSVTLSTFHGCPPDEIERIAAHVLRDRGLACVVKLNPMLLGEAETNRLLHDVLGHHDLRVPPSAFTRDTTWPQMCDFSGRLAELARSLGLGFGLKLTNTLIVENHRSFFPATEREMYLSGQPLHVLAIDLVRRVRGAFGASIPLSFSAGIDAVNVADAVALDLAPITTCTDLLRAGGYGRARSYFQKLAERMDAVGARTLGDFVIRAYGQGAQALEALDVDDAARASARSALDADGDLLAAAGPDVHRRWRDEAAMRNAAVYAARVVSEPRYTAAGLPRAPRKIGRHLQLFDCITCDKCIPVCPNDANFALAIPPGRRPVLWMHREANGWRAEHRGTLSLDEAHQIGTFADFCNDCGNCDVFCPEDGGPYVVKPRFFGSEGAWRESALDGFYLRRRGPHDLVRARIGGREFRLEVQDDRARFAADGVEVGFTLGDPAGTIAGDLPPGTIVDLGAFQIMDLVREGIFAAGSVNYVNCLGDDEAHAAGPPPRPTEAGR